MVFRIGRRKDLALLTATVGLIVAGLYVLGSGSGTAQTVPDPGNPNLTYEYSPDDPDLVVRFHLPKPDEGSAAATDAGLSTIESVPGVADVLTAVENADSSALLSLFQTEELSCSLFSRADERWCELNEEIDGRYNAIRIEDGGTRWTLAEARALKLFEAIFASGVPEPALATRDQRTADRDGVYYLAFSVPPFDASDPVFNYASDTVGTGFGVKIDAGAAKPAVEFSLLSEDWNPLKWVQNNGAPHHQLIFPETTDSYPAMFDGMEDDFYGR